MPVKQFPIMVDFRRAGEAQRQLVHLGLCNGVEHYQVDLIPAVHAGQMASVHGIDIGACDGITCQTEMPEDSNLRIDNERAELFIQIFADLIMWPYQQNWTLEDTVTAEHIGPHPLIVEVEANSPK